MSNLGNRPDVVIIGRPNVGKSSLLNCLAGKKEQIVTHKPHTTRSNHQISISIGNAQTIVEDTPGLVSSRPLNDQRMMRRSVGLAIDFTKLILLVLDVRRFTPNDEYLLKKCIDSGKPLFIAINKIDLVVKQKVFDYCKNIDDTFSQLDMIPISAGKNHHIEYLSNLISQEILKLNGGKQQELTKINDIDHLEVSEPAVENPAISNDDISYHIIQHLREQLLMHLHEELPYVCKLRIKKLEVSESGLVIAVEIQVPKKSNIAIVVGKQGRRLKSIGSRTRTNLSKYFHKPVQLFLQVKTIPISKQTTISTDML